MSDSKHTIYESRASTHADDCWSWGPGHYKCAVREIERLRTENARLREDAARYRQPKRRPYNASASLSEYGIFPECDAAPAAQAPRACTCHPDDRPDGPCRERYAASECQALAAQAPAANADALLDALRQIAEWPDGGERYGQEKIKRFAQHAIDAAMEKEVSND